MMPAAAWIGPALLLWFVRNHPVKQVLSWGIPALWVSGAVAMHGLVPMPDAAFAVFIAVAVPLGLLPYLLDRWLAPRLRGFVATLALPCIMVAWEYGQSFGNTGVWPSVANSQFGFNSLVQLASVTGLWGISFVVYWFAATVNWAAYPAGGATDAGPAHVRRRAGRGAPVRHVAHGPRPAQWTTHGPGGRHHGG
jgi:apolipoprotein N-acyltransferase